MHSPRNLKEHNLADRRAGGKRASVLLYAVVLITVAGVAAISWTGFVTDSYVQGKRDRARLYAFYAAESGVEQVVDWFNHAAAYPGAQPLEYTMDLATSPHPLQHNVHPDLYLLFEPYIRDYLRNDQGLPIDAQGRLVVDETGAFLDREPVVTNWTFLRQAGDPSSSKIPTCELDIEGLEDLVMRDGDGRELARVTSLVLVNPGDFGTIGDSSAPVDGTTICKVVARAETPQGVAVRVESILRENSAFEIKAPAAIMTDVSATFDGQFNVHWGEVWAKQDIALESNWEQKIPTQSEDPWVYVKTEGWLRDHRGRDYADGRDRSGFLANPPATTDPNYFIPFLEDFGDGTGGEGDGGDDKPGKGKGKDKGGDDTGGTTTYFTDRENLLQQQQLDFPDFDYDQWKEFFLTYDLPYFFTYTDGNLYGIDRDPSSETYGEIIGQSFDDWFAISPDDPAYFDTDKWMVFIDTIPTDASGAVAPLDPDGIPVHTGEFQPRPPASNGSNLATLLQAGGGVHTRGFMLIAANLTFRGQGNPSSSSSIIDPDGNPYVVDPDGNQPQRSFNVAHNGFMYSYGTITHSGNRTFYGSVYAEGGFAGNGAREIYYNTRLRDGSWLNLNQSRVSRSLWDMRSSDVDLTLLEESTGDS